MVYKLCINETTGRDEVDRRQVGKKGRKQSILVPQRLASWWQEKYALIHDGAHTYERVCV